MEANRWRPVEGMDMCIYLYKCAYAHSTKVLLDVMNSSKTAQIGYWLLNNENRHQRNMLSEVLVTLTKSHGKSPSTGLQRFVSMTSSSQREF